MIQNYIYKRENNPFAFWYENKKISLREYQKDLLFYWSGEEDKAEYAVYDKSPDCEKLPSIYTGGRFGSYSKVSSPLTFNGKNFESLTDNISLSLWLGANNVNGYCTYYLTKKGDWETLAAGDYSMIIQFDGEISKTLVIALKDGATFSTLKNKLSFELDPTKYNAEIDINQTTSETIAIKSALQGKTFKLSSGTEGTDILSLLNVSDIYYGTTPTENLNIISLAGKTSSLIISHIINSEDEKTISKLRFTYRQGETSKTTSIVWNNNGIDLDHIEVDIDSSVMYVFLNGVLLKTVLISPITKTAEEMILTINGNEENIYSIEELIIKSKLQNKETFTLPDSQLTKYDTTRPYIDFYFSGSNIYKNSLTNLTANCSDNIEMVLNYDGLFYYYSNGAWRSSDGSYNKSNDSYTFVDYINEFTFTGKDDLFIRCFFESDGDTEAWLEELYFTLNEESIYGDEKTTAAVLVGEIEFPDEENQDTGEMVPQTIEVGEKELIIQTDQGQTSITFPKDMILDEIIDYIKKQYPEGITSVYRDNADRIVLVSETKGDGAYIVVSGEAAEILFGKTTSAQGADQEKNTLENNYEEFIEKVKEYSSNDLIPIEIDDDQIRLYLQEAINLYKKYRNDEINTYQIQLSGNAKDGYEIPPVIEDWHDITDILFKPMFPIGFYTGSLGDEGEDLIAYTFVNFICGNNSGMTGYGKGFQADYYISLMSIKDMEKIMGLAPSWKVYNNRLYIFPNNISKYLNVTIQYKAPIDPIKAMRDPYIIQYVYGKIRMAQGEIRSQYGSQLSVSSIQMQFNGDTMYQRGQEAVKEALEGMQKNQEPLGFFWG